MTNLAGQHLGGYELVKVIGHGGMAVVYQAVQAALRRYVAIKLLPAYFVHEEGFRARFRQEAETVARLEHRNILPIYDYGQDGDIPYIVMPLISEGTLREWLSRAPPLEHALQVFDHVLDALDYAHSKQIVHRDLKPSNILMSQGNWPLLADFGIARIVGPSLRITHSGVLVGTPEYMAPEQSDGRNVDHRADIYAMGVILFEMLTGRLPYEGPTPMAIILKHVQDPIPSPRALNSSLSPAWDEVIQRCLAKRPEGRYESTRALAEAVRAAVADGRLLAGAWPAGGRPDPAHLHTIATQAMAEGDWPRVISLCSQILSVDPTHAAAVQLLTKAQEAFRRQQGDEQVHRATDLVRQAEQALAAEQFTIASRFFEEALAIVPDLPEAHQGLARIQDARVLAGLYYAARVDMAAERWDAAAHTLAQLEAQAPGYRDVASLLEEVTAQQQRQTRLSTLYEEGSAALAREDWQSAIAAFAQVVAAGPTYRDAAARLAEARQAENARRLLSSAQSALAAGRTQDAVTLLETLTRQAPHLVEARTLLASVQGWLHGPATSPVRPAPDLTPPPAVARPSAVATRAYVTNRGSGTVSVVDTGTNTVVANVPVGGGPLGVAAGANGLIYVTNRANNAVQALDPVACRLVATVPAGSGAYEVAVHPDGSRAYVTARFSGTLTVVDTASHRAVASVRVGRTPSTVAVHPTGARVYVTNFEGNSVSVVDTGTNEEVASIALPASSAPEGLAVSPDGARVYVACFRSDLLAVIDTALNRVVARIPVGSSPYGVAVHPDSSHVYVTDFDANTVSVIDARSQRRVATIPVAQWPRGVAISPDGAYLYVASRGTNSLQVIDTRTQSVAVTVEVGDGPQGVAVG